MYVNLRAKSQVSSVTLTSFRQEVILPPTSKRTPKKLTQIRVKVAQIYLKKDTVCIQFFYFVTGGRGQGAIFGAGGVKR